MLADMQIQTRLISVIEDGRMNHAVIDAAEFDGEYLRIRLRDGRLIYIPESWLSALSGATVDQRSHLQISLDGSTLFWPEVPAQLTTREILAGSEPCEACWYRVSFYK
jgi:hypothetical protein